MEKVNSKIECLYCIILIIISVFIIGRTGIISRLILYNIRNEVIPFANVEAFSGDDIIEEMIPSLAMLNEADGYYDLGYADETGGKDIINAQENGGNSSVVDTTAQPKDVNNNDSVTGNTDTALETDSSNQTEITNEADDGVDMEPDVPVVNLTNANNYCTTYTMEQLSDFNFLMSNCYIVDGVTSVTEDEINAETLLSMDMSMDLSGNDYKVLIYHTHGSEAFADSRPGVTEDTIIGVGDELTRILEEDYGIRTYHDRTVYDMVDGKLDRSYAYTLSGKGIDKILAENPSIEVILDVHRDGVREDLRLVKTIDGKETAQFMFFNGVSRLNEEGDLGYLYNPNKISNLSFSLQMYLKGKEMYGDLLRKIYIGGYCFNLDRKPRASLIEVGAQTNTVEEAKNAMTPLAAIIYSVLSTN